jgi:hypothetical protein
VSAFVTLGPDGTRLVVTSVHVIAVQDVRRCVVTVYRNLAAGWTVDAAGVPLNGDRADLRRRLSDDPEAVTALVELGVI